jgi:hypothetical protein
MALTINGVTILSDGIFIPFTLLDLPSSPSPEAILAGIINIYLSEITNELGIENGDLIGDESGNTFGFDNRDAYEQISLYFWGVYCVARGGNIVLRKEIILEMKSRGEAV